MISVPAGHFCPTGVFMPFARDGISAAPRRNRQSPGLAVAAELWYDMKNLSVQIGRTDEKQSLTVTRWH